MRILHAPTDLGMRAVSFSAVERQEGHESRVVVRVEGVHRSGMVTHLYSRNPFVYLWRILRAFWWALRADVLMFNEGSSVLDFPRFGLNLFDLRIYRALGKRVIVTYQGCDIRRCEICPVRTYIGPSERCVNLPPHMGYEQFDEWKLKRLDKYLPVAEKLLAITPDLCRTHPRIKYAPHVKHLPELPPIPDKAARKRLRVGHMPKPHVKGTPFILDTLDGFGDRIEVSQIKGLLWKDALERVSQCDLLVDQVVWGWYGGISVEGALMGVPAICYIDPDVLQYVDDDMARDLPVIVIHDRNELQATLTRYLDDREALAAEAERCRKSALRYHDARKISKWILEETER